MFFSVTNISILSACKRAINNMLTIVKYIV